MRITIHCRRTDPTGLFSWGLALGIAATVVVVAGLVGCHSWHRGRSAGGGRFRSNRTGLRRNSNHGNGRRDGLGAVQLGVALDTGATALGAGAAGFDCAADPHALGCALDIASVALGGGGLLADSGALLTDEDRAENSASG